MGHHALVAAAKDYQSGDDTIRALAETNLSLSPGDYLAISGPSGSGKSTLLNLFGLLERPTQGEIVVAGLPTQGVSKRTLATIRAEHIGFVFQDYHLLPGRSVLSNLASGLAYHPSAEARKNRHQRAKMYAAQLGLAKRMTLDVRRLSGGERQTLPYYGRLPVAERR